jgi:hypothetical protein
MGYRILGEGCRIIHATFNFYLTEMLNSAVLAVFGCLSFICWQDLRHKSKKSKNGGF